jgi:hypothetical protein
MQKDEIIKDEEINILDGSCYFILFTYFDMKGRTIMLLLSGISKNFVFLLIFNRI